MEIKGHLNLMLFALGNEVLISYQRHETGTLISYLRHETRIGHRNVHPHDSTVTLVVSMLGVCAVPQCTFSVNGLFVELKGRVGSYPFHTTACIF